MSSIRTLTLNPTVDLTWQLDDLEDGGKSRAHTRNVTGGGGGINVARAVVELGGDAVAVHSEGGEIGRRLTRLLDEEGLDHRAVEVAGETREALVLLVADGSRTYHVVPDGPHLSDDEAQRCVTPLLEELLPGSYVVLSGSLPEGLPVDLYGDIARRATEQGAHVVLDTSGPALGAALGQDIYLTKPNRREVAELIGRTAETFDDAREANDRLLSEGATEVAVTTLGDQGALCSSEEGHVELRTPPLPGEAVSDAGAGDSLIGAIVFRLAQGDAPAEACAWGVAAAAASVLTPGTELFARPRVEELRPRVRVVR